MTANEIASKFFEQATNLSTSPNGEAYLLVTKNMANWLFRQYDADMRKCGDRIHQHNGYDVASGEFSLNGVTMFWRANEWKYGAARIIYTYPKTEAAKIKSDTLVILEAVQEAFLLADDELDYSQLSQNEKDLLKAQRKAIAQEIRMNK